MLTRRAMVGKVLEAGHRQAVDFARRGWAAALLHRLLHESRHIEDAAIAKLLSRR